MRSRLGSGRRVSKPGLHDHGIFFLPHAQVFDPFVEPGGFERPGGHFSNGPGCIRPTQSRKGFFCLRADVGTTRVRRYTDPSHDQEGSEVCLIEHVHAGVRGEVPSIAEKSVSWVEVYCARWLPAILDVLELGRRGHEVLPRKEGLVLLVEGLRAEESGLEHELRDKWPVDVAVARSDLPAEQVLGRDRGGELKVLTAINEGQVIHVGHCFSNGRVTRIFSEGYIAQQGPPVMLDRFRCGYVAGDARRRRDDGGMGVKALKIQGKRNLGAIQLRVSTSPGSSDDDLCEVFGLAVLEGFNQAMERCLIGDPQSVMLQGLGIAAAAIFESVGIAIISLQPNTNVFSFGRIYAEIEAGIGPVRRIKFSNRCLSGGLFPAEQRLKWNSRRDCRGSGCAFDKVSSAETAWPALQTGRIIRFFAGTHDCFSPWLMLHTYVVDTHIRYPRQRFSCAAKPQTGSLKFINFADLRRLLQKLRTFTFSSGIKNQTRTIVAELKFLNQCELLKIYNLLTST